MKTVKVELSVEELSLLANLAADQLFRNEFIDPKMPGYKGNPAAIALGKELVVRLRAMIKQASESSGSASHRGPSRPPRNRNGAPHAV